MTFQYPLLTASQLKVHLKSLRVKKGLTQSQLGKLIGVRQARMAEIEARPETVSLEQLMKVLHHLGARLALQIAFRAEGEAASSVLPDPETGW